MQFAEDYFTNKKSDPQHRPSVRSCLIRIPGTINSKYNQEVIDCTEMGWIKTANSVFTKRLQNLVGS